MQFRAFPLVALLLTGCSSDAVRLNKVKQQTPTGWDPPPALIFHVVGPDGKALGTFTLQLTDTAAHTCVSGEWKEARPISWDLSVLPVAKWWGTDGLTPAYQIKGRVLTVELNGGAVCDDYPEVNAVITETGGHGALEAGGLFGGQQYGRVTIERQ